MHISTSTTSHYPQNQTLTSEIICFSHLRWDFVFQRPQHLLSRFARNMRVWYIEEPVYIDETQPRYVIHVRECGVKVMVPHLSKNIAVDDDRRLQKELFDDFMKNRSPNEITFWYYTPMALLFTRHYKPAITVFDCMDELSAFKFAPAGLKLMERELLNRADIVFTGGHSLFETKKHHHHNIHAFPSSIDKEHFKTVRDKKNSYLKSTENALKLGFYGVIDERFDTVLIKEIAQLRPNWQIELIGPVVKIEPTILPVLDNISYLGPKTYIELPEYMAGWNIALIPFLLNESTRFISPTKTPEYLAAGLPVISTPIADVVNPYGHRGLVSVGNNAQDFIDLAQFEINRDRVKWLWEVDNFLSNNSWDLTTESMKILMSSLLNEAT